MKRCVIILNGFTQYTRTVSNFITKNTGIILKYKSNVCITVEDIILYRREF